MRNVIVVLLTFCFMAFSNICFGMTFSQPMPIAGQIGAEFQKKNEGILIENAVFNNGNIIEKKLSYDKKRTKIYYDKGIAQFGSGEDVLYAHYDMHAPDKNIYFGGKEKNNAFPLLVTTNWQGEKFYKIKSDSDITLYLITCGWDMYGKDYYLLGRLNDGKWVKYIDSHEFSKNYFETKKDVTGREVVQEPAYSDLKVQGDTIIIAYSTGGGRVAPTKLGEFRFKWDDDAQWFGIEQVVY